MELIHKVQDEVRDNFTFQYEFVGSVQRNMVTWDVAKRELEPEKNSLWN